MKTDPVLRQEGLKILSESLGPVDMERFIVLLTREPFDYTEWHESKEYDLSVRQLSQAAMRQRSQQNG